MAKWGSHPFDPDKSCLNGIPGLSIILTFGWVCWWFLSLLWSFFSRFPQFWPLHRNYLFKSPIWPGNSQHFFNSHSGYGPWMFDCYFPFTQSFIFNFCCLFIYSFVVFYMDMTKHYSVIKVSPSALTWQFCANKFCILYKKNFSPP